jgi:hypothetical protein
MECGDIDRVLFTGDIFRPDCYGNPHQDLNINWLYHYFCSYFKLLVPGLQIERLSWCNGGEFTPAPFFSEFGLPLKRESWAQLYDFEGVSSEIDELINKYFIGSFVIAFELPPVLTNRLTVAGVPFLNLEIAPYRYLEDLCLETTTNNRELESFLIRESIHDADLLCEAGRIKSYVSRQSAILQDPTVLIVGQTVGDKSLISGGKFLSLDCYVEQIEKMSKKYSSVFYKPHPLDDGSFIDRRVLDSFGIDFIDVNIYSLFSQRNLIKVVGVSSSCLYESPFFGVDSIFFGKKRNVGSVLSRSFDSTSFWKGVLESLGIEVQDNIITKVAPPKNALRYNFGAWRAGNDFDTVRTSLAYENAVQELKRFKQTLSWRITKPLRTIGRFMFR